MKYLIIIIITMLTPTLLLAESGKYQLFQGEYESSLTVMDKKGELKESKRMIKTVFKINTETGETWILEDISIATTTGLTINRGWNKVEKNIEMPVQKKE